MRSRPRVDHPRVRIEGAFAIEPAPLTAVAGAHVALGEFASIEWRGDEIVSAEKFAGTSHTVVMPGLVCGHLEMGLAFAPGFPARKGESDDARTRRVLDAHDEASLAAAVRLAALEAAKAGVTVVFDLWRGKMIDGVLDVIASACAEVGIRAALSAGVDATRGVDHARKAIAENARFAQRESNGDRFRARMGVSDAGETLASAISTARKHEMGMHLLWGGTAASRKAAAERGVLRPGSVAVLAAPLDDEERALLRDLEVFVATTPRADAEARRERPAMGYLATRLVAGGHEWLADPLAEVEAARVTHAGEVSFDGARAFSLIARGWDLAAETFDRPFGRLAEGSPADMVVLEPALSAPLTAQTLPAYVRGLTSNTIRTVICAGETIVRDGASARVDETEVRARAREEARRVWARASA